MEIIHVTLGTCAMVLIVIASATAVSGQSHGWHDESFVLYINAGPSLPIGTLNDSLELGLHASGGLGLVLSSGSQLSPEINLRYSYSRFPIAESKSQSSADNLIQHQAENYFGLEGRFRIQNQSRLRPFFTLGIGLTTGKAHWVPDRAFVLGGGIDLATTSDGVRLVYGELRMISSTRSYLLFSIGLRIG